MSQRAGSFLRVGPSALLIGGRADSSRACACTRDSMDCIGFELEWPVGRVVPGGGGKDRDGGCISPTYCA